MTDTEDTAADRPGGTTESLGGVAVVPPAPSRAGILAGWHASCVAGPVIAHRLAATEPGTSGDGALCGHTLYRPREVTDAIPGVQICPTCRFYADHAPDTVPAPDAHRHPCPWCAKPQAWPDRCAESVVTPGDACSTTIETQCGRGDHRRCRVGACTVSTRWHDEVRAAGVAAARTAGEQWAVVSTIGSSVRVAGTADQLGRAESLLRNVLVDAEHDPDGAEGRGLVYIVRGSDGGLL